MPSHLDILRAAKVPPTSVYCQLASPIHHIVDCAADSVFPKASESPLGMEEKWAATQQAIAAISKAIPVKLVEAAIGNMRAEIAAIEAAIAKLSAPMDDPDSRIQQMGHYIPSLKLPEILKNATAVDLQPAAE